MSIERLVNYGIKTLNVEPECPAQNTVVVIGVARGGTSMTAGILYHLGVPMHAARPPVFEDQIIASVFESDDVNDSVIKDCDQADQWAFKRPLAIEYLAKLEATLRNPRFIFVFRDIFALANRSEISVSSDSLPLMQKALQQYAIAVDYLQTTSFPCLLCSSEKISRYPQESVRAIAGFCGLKPDDNKLAAAIRFINPEPAQYLRAARADRTHGQIETLNNREVKGWAAWWSRDEAALVEVYLNDELLTTVKACDIRADLVDKGRTRSGLCGFHVQFENEVSSGTVVRVKIQSDLTDLENSPQTI